MQETQGDRVEGASLERRGYGAFQTRGGGGVTQAHVVRHLSDPSRPSISAGGPRATSIGSRRRAPRAGADVNR